MAIEFVWDGAVYGIETDTLKMKEENIPVKLPDGSFVLAMKWFPTKPPRPLQFESHEPESAPEVFIDAVLIKEAAEVKTPLAHFSRRDMVQGLREKGKKLDVTVDVELEDLFSFTLNGFKAYLDQIITGEGKWGLMENIQFEMVGHDGNQLKLRVTANMKNTSG